MPEDIDCLITISRQTYFETFFDLFDDTGGYDTYTADVFAPDRLKAELGHPNSVFYLVFYNDHVIGYYKLNYRKAQSIFKGNEAAELERIYLLASYQGKQIGESLLQHAINTAKSNKSSYLWLAVWQHNHRAIKFYERHGLTKFDTNEYQIAGETQIDYLMHIKLL